MAGWLQGKALGANLNEVQKADMQAYIALIHQQLAPALVRTHVNPTLPFVSCASPLLGLRCQCNRNISFGACQKTLRMLHALFSANIVIHSRSTTYSRGLRNVPLSSKSFATTHCLQSRSVMFLLF